MFRRAAVISVVGRRFKSNNAPTDGKSLQNAFLRAVNSAATTKSGGEVPTPSVEVPKQAPAAPVVPQPAAAVRPAPIPAPIDHDNLLEFAPKILVIGVGGGGCNAVNNMISRGLTGVRFLCANTDAQHLATSMSEHRLQLGKHATQGLGCGANPAVGQAAAEESREEIAAAIGDAHMVFITAGMGGGTGTGAAPVIADVCREKGVLRVAVVTKPFRTEGRHRTKLAIEGMKALHDLVDTMIVIPNDNIFKLADLSTPIVDAYSLADDVCLAGVKSITDLMIKPGRINLDFADVRTVMKDMGNAVMGTGQAEGEDRAVKATIDALRNPLLGGDMSIRTAKGVLVNVTSGSDFTLGEWQQVTEKIIDEVEDEDAAVIMGHSIDNSMGDSIRVSIVATGIDLE